MASMSGLRWLRIILCAIAAFITAIISVFVFVAGYAMIEGFKVMGQPDQAKIEAFAGEWAPIVGPIASMLFAFLFALLAARTPTKRFMQGLMTGVVYGGVSLVLGLRGGISLGDFVSPLLVVLTGAAAGKLAERNEPGEVPTTDSAS